MPMGSFLIVAAGLTLAWALSFVWAFRRVPSGVAEEMLARIEQAEARADVAVAELEVLSIGGETQRSTPDESRTGGSTTGASGEDASGDLGRVNPAAPVDPAPGARLLQGFQRPGAKAGTGEASEPETAEVMPTVPAAARAAAEETWRKWNAG